MAEPVPPLRQLRIVAGAILASSVMVLGVAFFVRGFRTAPATEALAYPALAFALVSPLMADLVRRKVLGAAESSAAPNLALRRATIISFAILEAAAMLCAFALMLGTSTWPLLAAAVPLGAMVVLFPRD